MTTKRKEKKTDITSELHSLADRGARAESMLGQIREVLKGMRQNKMEEFAASDLDDEAHHRYCRIYLNLIDDFYTHLIVAINAGDVARSELGKVADRAH